jgi:hypothetical protein
MVTTVAWGFPTQSLQRVETHVGLHVKCSLSDFIQNCDMLIILVKFPNITFNENLFSRSRVFSSVQTDRQMDGVILIGANHGCELTLS